MRRMDPAVFEQPDFEDHELLDSGAGEKLERLGPVVLRRPDPQALWTPRLDAAVWDAAHLAFERDPESGGKRGRWRLGPGAPSEARGAEPQWTVSWRDATFLVRPTPFKHIGLFPEQATNWAWIQSARPQLSAPGGEAPRLLNLFGYTGAASVIAAQAGYEVTHIDASKTSIAWTRENASASGLGAGAFRVLVEDALVFCRRELRRRSVYSGIVMDPPHHGRGPKGETWQFEDGIAELVAAAGALLRPQGFLLLSSYAFGTSPVTLAGLLGDLEGGQVEAGELALRESSGDASRSLSCGFCARFQRGLDE